MQLYSNDWECKNCLKSSDDDITLTTSYWTGESKLLRDIHWHLSIKDKSEQSQNDNEDVQVQVSLIIRLRHAILNSNIKRHILAKNLAFQTNFTFENKQIRCYKHRGLRGPAIDRPCWIKRFNLATCWSPAEGCYFTMSEVFAASQDF